MKKIQCTPEQFHNALCAAHVPMISSLAASWYVARIIQDDSEKPNYRCTDFQLELKINDHAVRYVSMGATATVYYTNDELNDYFAPLIPAIVQ